MDPSSGEPNGEWIAYLNKDFLKITDADDCTYYRVINFKKGIIEGKAAYYYKSGKLFFEAALLSVDPDVFKDGEVIYYNEDGTTKQKYTFKNNKLNSSASFFNSVGYCVREGSCISGVPDGLWHYFDDNGNKISEGVWTKGKKTGIWTNFNPDGSKLAEGKMEKGVRNGICTEWYSDGTYGVGKYKQDIQDGEWKYYDEYDRLKSRGPWVKGIQNGIWTFFDTDGKMSSRGVWSNGKQTGNWAYYDASGQVFQSGKLYEGNRTGIWKEIGKDGKYMIGPYVDNKKNGEWKIFTAEGKLTQKGNYIKDKQEGVWYGYNDKGIADFSLEFKNGKPVK